MSEVNTFIPSRSTGWQRKLGAALLLAFVILSLPSLALSGFMLPQKMPQTGPWFEGWYYRFTDPQNQRSFAVLVSRLAPVGSKLSSQPQVLPGHVTFLIQAGPNQPTESFEFFPKNAKVHSTEKTFVWQAAEVGYLSHENLDIQIPGGDCIQVQMGQRKPWSQSHSNWGPNGISTFLDFMPLHWWVESLGSVSQYRIIRKNGEILEGNAFAHLEKNWGESFPSAWMWLQATNSDNTSHLIVAGGPLKIGPLTVTPYLVGYKSPKYDVEIRPDQMFDFRYETEIHPEFGRFVLRAMNSEYYIRIQAAADVKSFAPVSIPTRTGYLTKSGIESFSATIQVDLRQKGSLLESRIFTGAALEFGGDFMNPGQKK